MEKPISFLFAGHWVFTLLPLRWSVLIVLAGVCTLPGRTPRARQEVCSPCRGFPDLELCTQGLSSYVQRLRNHPNSVYLRTSPLEDSVHRRDVEMILLKPSTKPVCVLTAFSLMFKFIYTHSLARSKFKSCVRPVNFILKSRETGDGDIPDIQDLRPQESGDTSVVGDQSPTRNCSFQTR